MEKIIVSARKFTGNLGVTYWVKTNILGYEFPVTMDCDGKVFFEALGKVPIERMAELKASVQSAIDFIANPPPTQSIG
jgi:hypothetical protein